DAMQGADLLDRTADILVRTDAQQNAVAGTAFSRRRKQREIGLGVGDRPECRGPAAVASDPDRLAYDAVEGQDMPHPERAISRVPYAMAMEEGRPVTLADD